MSPRFEHLLLEDGLSQGSIHDIFQDSRGFIWLSTQDGINRFDGHDVKSFTHEPFDETSLSSGFSLGIDEDRHGALWIAVTDGLSKLDPLTETFTTYRHDPDDPESLSDNRVWGVTVDSDGWLWIGTGGGGLNRMHPDRPGVFERFSHNPDDEQSLCDNVIHKIFEDSAGEIWLGSKNGICVTDRTNPGQFEKRMLDGPRPRPSSGFTAYEHEVYDFVERPEQPGVFWIGTSRNLVRLNVETGEVEKFVIDPDYEGANTRYNAIWRLTQDPANPSILWVPTMGAGLARFDVRAKQFIVYQADENNPNGLLENSITSVYTDRSGVVWAGATVSGVSRFNPASVSFAHFRAGSDEDPLSLPGENVWAIHESRDGLLWVSTQDRSNQARLTVLDRANGTSRHFEHDPRNPFSRDPGNPMLIFEDDQNNLWVGSDRGVDLLDRSTGRFGHFRADRDDPSTIPGEARSMLVDRGGNLWVGTNRGLARMRADEFGRFDHFVNDPENPKSIARGSADYIIEDLAGFIWVAGFAGLSRLDPETGEATNYTHDPDDRTSLGSRNVNWIHERSREAGVLWLGLQGGGLDRLDVRTGEIRHFTERNGLPNNSIYGILEDDQGRLWMTSNHGLSRLDPDTFEFKNYGLEIGLQGLEFSEHALHKCRHGEFFLGGTNGMNAFFPNEISDNLNVPEVRLVDLKLFNESVMSTGAVALEKPLSQIEEITLDYSQKEVTFDFVAFHYADPTGNEYAYKLDGFNDDWVNVGDQRTASFTNLDPGEYTFHVKAANSDGVWNEEGASIRLVVAPPFWMTWWFRILGVLVFGGVILGGYRIRTAQLEARAKELEGLVDERTAELKESNDQLEQSSTIVEAINQETSFTRVLTKILEESRIIPGVEKATAIVYMPFEDRFIVRASSGWDVDAMKDIKLTRSQAQSRYIDQSEEVSPDVFVAKNVGQRAGSDQMAQFGNVASFLVLRVRVEDNVVAYLVFDNLSDENAFDGRDVELLGRLREHITSAFIKTRILEDLESERSNLQGALDELRSTQDRLVQSEKMASLGQLTAGIAHEIKNPLNFVNNFSEMSAELTDDLAAEVEKRKDTLPADFVDEFESILDGLRMNSDKIAEHGKRADGIVQNMLEHSKTGEGQRAPTDLNDLLEEYLVLAHHRLRAEDGDFDIHIERDLDDSIGKVEIIPQEMGRVFMNLIGNAFDALRASTVDRQPSDDGPALTVSTQRNDANIEIRIADNGPGIPPDVRDRIFEPFFTTKPTGSGTGLGLSMSYDIVTKGHNGSLEVESVVGEGATFIISLPV